MKELQVTPRTYSKRPRLAEGLRGMSVAFFVFGTAGTAPAPAFERLLSGVSAAAEQHDLSLMFSFVSDPALLPPRLDERRVAGLLLHGERPTRAVQDRLRALPTVWLMANRERPEWGDQVLPDNSAIGEMAADYLIRRGHERVAYLGTRSGMWAMEIRSFAFARAAGDAGATADVFEVHEESQGDLWSGEGLRCAGRELVERVLAAKHRPTGLFVSEDRLLPAIDAALTARGLSSGPGGNVELISCNNERAHLTRLRNAPAAEIDIRVESIGRRGVDQLVWRLRNPRGLDERIRAMIEPVLVEPIAPAPVVPISVGTMGVELDRLTRVGA
jgi:DNA-binding LacI/PurR family transcriptional regulator